MAVLLTGVPVSDEQAKEQAPVETPETDKPVDGEDSAPVCVPEGWASLVDLDPDAEASLTELLRLMKQERYDVIPSLSGYLVTEDPTNLPEDAVVRAMARQLGRDRMLALLIIVYLRAHTDAEGS